MTIVAAPVNQGVTAIDQVVHTAVMTLALNAAEKALIAQFPELELPVLHQIFEAVLHYAFNYIDQALEQVAAFEVIDGQTDAEAKAYQDAVSQLAAALAKGDPNAISQANQTFSNDLGPLIHFDGS